MSLYVSGLKSINQNSMHNHPFLIGEPDVIYKVGNQVIYKVDNQKVSTLVLEKISIWFKNLVLDNPSLGMKILVC